MSWLGKKIQQVVNKQTPETIDAAIAQMMQEVIAEYQLRRDQGNLRVTDDSGEGVLIGERGYTTENPETHALELTCDPLTVERGREEAYSRALFNQKASHVDGQLVQIISYEAPLLRQHAGHGGNICKLDLVGLAHQAIFPIEYKHTHGPATSSRYGIIEGLAYAVLIAKHIVDSPDAINQQVSRCVQGRGPFPGGAIQFDASNASVRYYVAAPHSFFIEDTRTTARVVRTNRFVDAVRRFLQAFSQNSGRTVEFGGFLVIGGNNPGFNARPVGEHEVAPTFNPGITDIPAFHNVADLQHFIRPHRLPNAAGLG